MRRPGPERSSGAFIGSIYRPWSLTARWKRGIVPPLHGMTPKRRGHMASHIGRRKLLATLGGAATWPLAAHAQQMLKAARIGYLTLRSPMSIDDAFFQGLRDLGWIEGQTIIVERRFAAGNIDQLKDSAAELVHLKVDLIVTAASAATQAAKDATASIPHCFYQRGRSGWSALRPEPRAS